MTDLKLHHHLHRISPNHGASSNPLPDHPIINPSVSWWLPYPADTSGASHSLVGKLSILADDMLEIAERLGDIKYQVESSRLPTWIQTPVLASRYRWTVYKSSLPFIRIYVLISNQIFSWLPSRHCLYFLLDCTLRNRWRRHSIALFDPCSSLIELLTTIVIIANLGLSR